MRHDVCRQRLHGFRSFPLYSDPANLLTLITPLPMVVLSSMLDLRADGLSASNRRTEYVSARTESRHRSRGAAECPESLNTELRWSSIPSKANQGTVRSPVLRISGHLAAHASVEHIFDVNEPRLHPFGVILHLPCGDTGTVRAANLHQKPLPKTAIRTVR